MLVNKKKVLELREANYDAGREEQDACKQKF